MKIAAHQPEHFPYLGFFQKMKEADLFVILDDVQYTKGNFQNRNQFKNKNGVDEWFTIELEQHANKKLISEVTVSENLKWKNTILNKLKTNFSVNLEHIYDYKKLIDINLESINYCRKKLNIDTPLVFSSTLNLKTNGSQKLSDMCDSLNATEYISGQGAKKYLNEDIFNCKISFFEPKVTDYYTTLQHI